jgi:hypothetical protein
MSSEQPLQISGQQRLKSDKALPPEDYPTLVACADELTLDDQDGLFQFGVDLFLNGLEPLVRRR